MLILKNFERRWMSVPVLASALCIVPSYSFAQQQDPSVEAALDCFELRAVDGSQQCGVVGVRSIVTNPQDYSTETVEGVLDGLERLALSSNDRRVRVDAVVWLSTAGRTSATRTPYSGVVARLLRLYETSEDRAVRMAAVSSLVRQADAAAAVSFLETVAREDRRDDRAAKAVQNLTGYGDQGRAALQRLYDHQDDVKSANARLLLKTLEETSFKFPGRGFQEESDPQRR